MAEERHTTALPREEEPAAPGPAGAAAPPGPEAHQPSPDPATASGEREEPTGPSGPGEAASGAPTPPASDGLAAAGEVAEASVAAAEVEEDLQDLARVTGERDQYLALAQRTQADFENFRKRAAREARAAEGRGVARVIREFLPALDNLERAVDHAALDDPLLEGIRLVQADLSSALSRLGVQSFSPAGEPFDPAEHEAVAQQPVEGADTGTVVEVYQAGYRLDGSVLRPARVVVAA